MNAVELTYILRHPETTDKDCVVMLEHVGRGIVQIVDAVTDIRDLRALENAYMRACKRANKWLYLGDA